MPYCGDHGKTWRSSAQDPEVSTASSLALLGFYGNARSPRRRAAGAKKTGSKADRALCALYVPERRRPAGGIKRDAEEAGVASKFPSHTLQISALADTLWAPKCLCKAVYILLFIPA